ncbi:MAG: hypothetical protein KGK10_03170 [Rhodospirillales bacterium]|nr:hypothetical protein [Rhodospirillales bacterium]
MPRHTTGEAVVEALLAHGMGTLYALPGVHNDHLFDAVARSDGRMRIVHTRHEQTAAYMALGAALATGRPQAFSVVPGPGLLNASAALLSAYGAGAPVLALVGQIPSFAIDRGLGHLHELRDQLGLLGHMTKFAARIEGPAAAPGLVARAVHEAMSGRQRPVALECAIDVWGQSAEVVPVAPIPPVRPPLDLDAVARAAALMAEAKRPIIVAGSGAHGASAELLAFVERLGAPVVTYRRGRGVLATTHPLAAALPVGNRLWAEADLAIGVGTRMLQPLSIWGTDARLKLVRIDIDAEEATRFRHPDVAIVADAAEALAALTMALPARREPHPAIAREQAWLADRLARQEPQMGFLRAIRAALPDDGILVEDVTQLAFVARVAFDVAAPRRYIAPGYQDNLGWGYGIALGAQDACRDRAVVCVAGDGGFMYQAGELATAVAHNLPLVVVVFDDGAFGNVRRIQQHQFGNRLIASDLTNPDFRQFAESFGVRAWKVSDAEGLESALREALAARKPGLIAVRVGEMPSPWDMLVGKRVRGMDEAWRPNMP